MSIEKQFKKSLKVFPAVVLVASVHAVSGVSHAAGKTSFCGDEFPQEALNLKQIVPKLYETVSGYAGQAKNWDVLRQLHSPDAVITPIFHKNNQPEIASLSVEKFIALNKSIFKDSNFFETEVSHKIYQLGHMATVLSHYESREHPDKKPYSQGVNSFQLVNDGVRWCVISVTWDSDKGGHTVNQEIELSAG